VITVVENTGYDSYLCLYDLPDIESVKMTSKEELEESRQVEFRKTFILKNGKECM